MYGKHFASMYEGSMFGAGCHVFATWGYIIAKADSADRIEINPKMVAAILGATVEEVEQALEYLQQPDPNSRNQEHEGRRIVKEGQFQYFIPSRKHYSQIKSPEERREYNRVKQAEYRAKKKQTEDVPF